MRPQRSRPQHLLTREKVSKLIHDAAGRRFADGGNLYLDVPGGARAPSWVMRYKSPVTGKEREYRIGNESDYTLALARARAAEVRGQLDKGIDPLDARIAAREQAKRAAQAGQPSATLKAEAEALHALMTFKTPKAQKQWLSRLERNVPREIWLKPIALITEHDIKRFLQPLWATKYPTAKKVRQRLEAVWHNAREYAPHNAPAAIKRDLKQVKKKHSEQHHRALPVAEMPAFVRELRLRPGVSARALEFQILTAARPNEVVRLDWRDIEGDRWTVPAHKMKGEAGEQEEHVVFLSKAARAVLDQVRGLHKMIVFPGQSRDGRMSSNTMLNLIERMGKATVMTGHGCRGTFSKWAYGRQQWSEDVVEACLAHRERDRIKNAYAAGMNIDAFRADCLARWAEFLDPRGGKQRTRLKVVA